MAQNDATAVLSGRPNVTGAVTVLDIGSTLPTDASTAVAGGTALGYVGDDGLTNSYSRDSEQIREWGGRIVRVLQTDVTDTWALAFIQSASSDVLKAVWGDTEVTVVAAVPGTSGEKITVARDGAPLPAKVFVFDMVDAGNKRRVVLPNAQITETEDIAYQRGAAVQYGVTITAYPDENGVSSYEYLEAPTPAA